MKSRNLWQRNLKSQQLKITNKKQMEIKKKKNLVKSRSKQTDSKAEWKGKGYTEPDNRVKHKMHSLHHRKNLNRKI